MEDNQQQIRPPADVNSELAKLAIQELQRLENGQGPILHGPINNYADRIARNLGYDGSDDPALGTTELGLRLKQAVIIANLHGAFAQLEGIQTNAHRDLQAIELTDQQIRKQFSHAGFDLTDGGNIMLQVLNTRLNYAIRSAENKSQKRIINNSQHPGLG